MTNIQVRQYCLVHVVTMRLRYIWMYEQRINRPGSQPDLVWTVEELVLWEVAAGISLCSYTCTTVPPVN